MQINKVSNSANIRRLLPSFVIIPMKTAQVLKVISPARYNYITRKQFMLSIFQKLQVAELVYTRVKVMDTFES